MSDDLSNGLPAGHALSAEEIDSVRAWSIETFGPGSRVAGVVAHIRKELVEVEAAPHDISEWADVIILAFDGAMRSGSSGQEVVDAVRAKWEKNRSREWPDWRTQPGDGPFEHVREPARPVRVTQGQLEDGDGA